MNLTNLQRHWLFVSEQLGLSVKIDFPAKLSNGTVMVAEVLLEGYGSKNGMLLLSGASHIRELSSIIVASGFGFSCLSQPSDREIQSLAGVEDLLTDWGSEKESYA